MVVSSPDPTPKKEEEGLVTFECFLRCALSAKKILSCDSHKRSQQALRAPAIAISRAYRGRLADSWCLFGSMVGRHLRVCRAQIPTLVLFVAFHCLFPAKGDSSIRLLKQTLTSTNSSFSMLFLATTSLQVTLRNTYANILVSLM